MCKFSLTSTNPRVFHAGNFHCFRCWVQYVPRIYLSADLALTRACAPPATSVTLSVIFPPCARCLIFNSTFHLRGRAHSFHLFRLEFPVSSHTISPNITHSHRQARISVATHPGIGNVNWRRLTHHHLFVLLSGHEPHWIVYVRNYDSKSITRISAHLEGTAALMSSSTL
jgi:hypothetical protein